MKKVLAVISISVISFFASSINKSDELVKKELMNESQNELEAIKSENRSKLSSNNQQDELENYSEEMYNLGYEMIDKEEALKLQEEYNTKILEFNMNTENSMIEEEITEQEDTDNKNFLGTSSKKRLTIFMHGLGHNSKVEMQDTHWLENKEHSLINSIKYKTGIKNGIKIKKVNGEEIKVEFGHPTLIDIDKIGEINADKEKSDFFENMSETLKKYNNAIIIPKIDSTIRINDQVKQLKKIINLIEEHQEESYDLNLIGYSMGGLINVGYAVENPDKVKNLMSFATPYKTNALAHTINIIDFGIFKGCRVSFLFSEIDICEATGLDFIKSARGIIPQNNVATRESLTGIDGQLHIIREKFNRLSYSKRRNMNSTAIGTQVGIGVDFYAVKWNKHCTKIFWKTVCISLPSIVEGSYSISLKTDFVVSTESQTASGWDFYRRKTVTMKVVDISLRINNIGIRNLNLSMDFHHGTAFRERRVWSLGYDYLKV